MLVEGVAVVEPKAAKASDSIRIAQRVDYFKAIGLLSVLVA
jgi:hypothetical protein